MEPFHTRLASAGQESRLSSEEALRAEGALLAFMKQNPVNMSKAVQRKESGSHPGLVSFFSWRFSPMLASILVLLGAGSGISYAAGYALPGDTLYPIKIHVNENVETALAFTPEQQVAVATMQAERRAAEASALVATGRMTSQRNADLMVAFNEHIDTARTAIRHQQHLNQADDATATAALDKEAADLAVSFEHSSTAVIAAAIAPSAAATIKHEAESAVSSALSSLFMHSSSEHDKQKEHPHQPDIAITDDTTIPVPVHAVQTMMQLHLSGSGSASETSSTASGSSVSSKHSDDEASEASTPIIVNIQEDGNLNVQLNHVVPPVTTP